MTTTTTQYDTLTTGECMEVISNAIDYIAAGNQISSDELRVIHYGVTNNVQIRDYFMGLSVTYNREIAIEIINTIRKEFALLNLEDIALSTVLASYVFESGDISKAIILLGAGISADYTLAHLLNRVIIAEWSAESFATMRAELHPTVIEKINETLGDLVNESLRAELVA